MAGSVNLSDLKLGDLIDKGGEGEVWSVANRPNRVFKKYFATNAHEAGLAGLIAFAATLPPDERRLLDESTAWPTELVMDGGRFVGFLMQRVPAAFFGRANGKPRIREMQYLLYEPKPMWGDITPLDAAGRVEVVRHFVTIVDMLHRYGVVLGDISHRNALWRMGEPPQVFLLDCDSARIGNARSVLQPKETPDWNDPQGIGQPDVASDRYKTALLVGRVLARDAYIRPGGALSVLPGVDPKVAELVGQAFADAAGPRDARPDLATWIRALRGRGTIQLTPPVPRPALPELPKAPLHTPRDGARTMIPMRPTTPGP